MIRIQEIRHIFCNNICEMSSNSDLHKSRITKVTEIFCNKPGYFMLAMSVCLFAGLFVCLLVSGRSYVASRGREILRKRIGVDNEKRQFQLIVQASHGGSWVYALENLSKFYRIKMKVCFTALFGFISSNFRNLDCKWKRTTNNSLSSQDFFWDSVVLVSQVYCVFSRMIAILEAGHPC